MNRQYLIPANSKQNKLIFGIFRSLDLAIFSIGVTTSLFMLVIIKSDASGVMFIELAPICIATLLIIPVAYYHNVRVFIYELFMFLFGQRKYKWKGWCVYNEYAKDNDK